MLKSMDMMQDSYLQEMYRCIAVGMFCLVFSYSVLLAAMTLILCRSIKGADIMAWQDVLLLSVLNFVGSMIAGVVKGLLTVKIDTGFFVLFDERPDLLWKISMIAIFIFAGETALIYFWQRYRVLLAERQKHFVEEQQVKATKKRLEEADNFYGSIRKVRHEMKNHMANIKGLAGAGQYGEIEDYVRRMDETMQDPALCSTFRASGKMALPYSIAQGHVRKLAALLHVPRAASRGRWLFPTRFTRRKRECHLWKVF